MARIIPTFEQFQRKLYQEAIMESKASDGLDIYNDFVLVVQPGSSRKKPIKVHVFAKIDGKAYKVKELDVPYAGRVPLHTMDGLTDKHNYYLGDVPEGLSARIKNKGVLKVKGVQKILVTLDRDYEDMGLQEFGGLKGFVLTGEKHSLSSSAITRGTIDKIPVQGEETNRYAFYSELSPGKKIKIIIDRKEEEDEDKESIKDRITARDITFSVAAEFKVDSSDITERNTQGSTPEQAINRALGRLLKEMKAAGKKEFAIDIYAFASTEGDTQYNRRLSQRRADAIARHINSLNKGIVVKKAVGMGETSRFGDNLADNRRIVATPAGKGLK